MFIEVLSSESIQKQKALGNLTEAQLAAEFIVPIETISDWASGKVKLPEKKHPLWYALTGVHPLDFQRTRKKQERLNPSLYDYVQKLERENRESLWLPNGITRKEVIRKFEESGFTPKTGKATKITQAVITSWLNKDMPAEFVLKWCDITGALPEHIRPDIWPDVTDTESFDDDDAGILNVIRRYIWRNKRMH